MLPAMRGAPKRNGNQSSNLLHVSQVAALPNFRPNTVRRWTQQGIFSAYRIGPRGDRRFLLADVKRVLESNPV
jgi:hypothetical protein